MKRVRAFMEAKVAPVYHEKYWVDDDLSLRAAAGREGAGHWRGWNAGLRLRGRSLALLGFVQMEIARIDPSFSTFMGVHIGLAMGSIYIDGYARKSRRRKWLPPWRASRRSAVSA